MLFVNLANYLKLAQLLKGQYSPLVEGREGLNLPNCQTNLVIALNTLFLLFYKFINITAYHLGRYEPSFPVSCHAPWHSLFKIVLRY